MLEGNVISLVGKKILKLSLILQIPMKIVTMLL